jgi:hypothetical protein
MVESQHLQREIFSRTEKENRVESLPSPNSKKFRRLHFRAPTALGIPPSNPDRSQSRAEQIQNTFHTFKKNLKLSLKIFLFIKAYAIVVLIQYIIILKIQTK